MPQKIQVWGRISEGMKAASNALRSGKEMALRCQQNWLNLQRGYFKYKRYHNRTGAEYVNPPEYFSIIDLFLGKKIMSYLNIFWLQTPNLQI